MSTIIDGYNLIFSMGWQEKSTHSMALENSRNRLFRELSRRVDESDRTSTTIVFDANKTPLKEAPAAESQRGFRVLYAQQFPDADSMIEEMIRTHASPKSLVVVSDDNRIKVAATRRKAIAVGCEDWLQQIESESLSAADDEPDSIKVEEGLDSVDWMKEFDLKPGQELGDPDNIFNPFPPGYGE